MADIPQAILDRLDQQQRTIDELLKKADQNTVRSVQQESEERLNAIRKKSLFQGMGEPVPHRQGVGNYPFALYKKSTRMVPKMGTNAKGEPIQLFDANGQTVLTPELDVRGDPMVDIKHVNSDTERDAALADGWFVNPLGIAEKRK